MKSHLTKQNEKWWIQLITSIVTLLPKTLSPSEIAIDKRVASGFPTVVGHVFWTTHIHSFDDLLNQLKAMKNCNKYSSAQRTLVVFIRRIAFFNESTCWSFNGQQSKQLFFFFSKHFNRINFPSEAFVNNLFCRDIFYWRRRRIKEIWV